MADPTLTEQIANFDRVVLERDADLALTVLHPDYALVISLPVIAVMPRERWLAVLPDYLVHAYEVQEQRVEVLGSSAAVLQRVEMTATVLGDDRSGRFVISDHWLHGDAGWRVWRR
ncbi:MAG TPA: DUF4440 domain-containing protein, partial [Actinotalea sp.]